MASKIFDGNSIKYEDRILAFVDILGFKQSVMKSQSDPEELKKITKALNTILSANTLNVFSEIQVTTFSDSIVISYPDTKDNLIYLLLVLIHLQLELMFQGVFIRGGIALGQAVHVDSVVFGPAMVNAYELESNYAIYPRIILDKSLVDYELSTYSGQKHELGVDISYLKTLLKEDLYNDMFYIDTLHQTFEFTSQDEYIALLNKVKSTIETGLKESSKVVRSKYVWFKNYFNDTIENDEELSKKIELIGQ